MPLSVCITRTSFVATSRVIGWEYFKETKDWKNVWDAVKESKEDGVEKRLKYEAD